MNFHREAAISAIVFKLRIPRERLMDHLQVNMAPTVVSDEASKLDDVPIGDLREAMRVVCGR